MPYVDINGVSLHYIEQGSGPVNVIMGHGLLTSTRLWQDQYFPRFPADWHVLALDFRGHGLSVGVQEGCTFRQLAADIAAFAGAMDIGSYCYVGLSMGGGVGLQLALNHPAGLRGMALVSPVTGLGTMGNRFLMTFGTMMAGSRPMVRRALAGAASGEPDRKGWKAVIDDGMLVTKETLRQYLEPSNVIDGVAGISLLKIPSLVVVGDRDGIIPPAQQRLLAATLPGCTEVVLPGVGHGAVGQASAAIADHVVRFVRGLGDPAV